MLPGSSHEQPFKYSWRSRKNAGNAVYKLSNTPQPIMSLTVKFSRPDKRVEIQYNGELASLNNPMGSLISLGYVRDGGSVLFALAGNGTDSNPFVSSNPPTAWMQATIKTIGSKSLREFSMPASHDSGMSEVTGLYGGVRHNTITQTRDIFSQLCFGARHFDIRPIRFRSSFWTGHFSKTRSGAVGCTGRSLSQIVDDINRFNAQYPGELIILDISHDMNAKQRFQPFSRVEWQELYKVLSQISDLWKSAPASHAEDLSTIPISAFITPGSQSAVLVRLPDEAPAPSLAYIPEDPAFAAAETSDSSSDIDVDAPRSSTTNVTRIPSRPLAREAFLPAHRLPRSGSWSDTTSPAFLSSDQLSKLRLLRGASGAEAHMSVWTLSQSWRQVTDVGNRRKSIVAMAVQARRALFAELWPAVVKGGIWPNLVQIDDLTDTGVLALCMAVNEWFLGGTLER